MMERHEVTLRVRRPCRSPPTLVLQFTSTSSIHILSLVLRYIREGSAFRVRWGRCQNRSHARVALPAVPIQAIESHQPVELR